MNPDVERAAQAMIEDDGGEGVTLLTPEYAANLSKAAFGSLLFNPSDEAIEAMARSLAPRYTGSLGLLKAEAEHSLRALATHLGITE